MVPEFYAWQAAQAERDIALIYLAGCALILVVSWVITNYLPEQYVKPLQKLFLIGGIPLYIASLFFSWVFQELAR